MTKLSFESRQRISRYAEAVVDRGLDAPVMFFLESHLPVTGLMNTLGLVLEPLVTPFFGAERITALRELLCSPEGIEGLMQEIERYSIAKIGENNK